MRAVGIGYFLPSSKLPIDVEFRIADDAVEYKILIGSDDDVWKGLTDSKSWKAVYMYAVEGAEPSWNWDDLIEGSR